MKHTPGPWKEIYGNKIAIVGTMPLGDTDSIAVIYSLNQETKEANARLIAVAPELLEFCYEIVLEPYKDSDLGSLLETYQARAKNLIAKAEGEPT